MPHAALIEKTLTHDENTPDSRPGLFLTRHIVSMCVSHSHTFVVAKAEAACTYESFVSSRCFMLRLRNVMRDESFYKFMF